MALGLTLLLYFYIFSPDAESFCHREAEDKASKDAENRSCPAYKQGRPKFKSERRQDKHFSIR